MESPKSTINNQNPLGLPVVTETLGYVTIDTKPKPSYKRDLINSLKFIEAIVEHMKRLMDIDEFCEMFDVFEEFRGTQLITLEFCGKLLKEASSESVNAIGRADEYIQTLRNNYLSFLTVITNYKNLQRDIFFKITDGALKKFNQTIKYHQSLMKEESIYVNKILPFMIKFVDQFNLVKTTLHKILAPIVYDKISSKRVKSITDMMKDYNKLIISDYKVMLSAYPPILSNATYFLEQWTYLHSSFTPLVKNIPLFYERLMMLEKTLNEYRSKMEDFIRAYSSRISKVHKVRGYTMSALQEVKRELKMQEDSYNGRGKKFTDLAAELHTTQQELVDAKARESELKEELRRMKLSQSIPERVEEKAEILRKAFFEKDVFKEIHEKLAKVVISDPTTEDMQTIDKVYMLINQLIVEKRNFIDQLDMANLAKHSLELSMRNEQRLLRSKMIGLYARLKGTVTNVEKMSDEDLFDAIMRLKSEVFEKKMGSIHNKLVEICKRYDPRRTLPNLEEMSHIGLINELEKIIIMIKNKKDMLETDAMIEVLVRITGRKSNEFMKKKPEELLAIALPKLDEVLASNLDGTSTVFSLMKDFLPNGMHPQNYVEYIRSVFMKRENTIEAIAPVNNFASQLIDIISNDETNFSKSEGFSSFLKTIKELSQACLKIKPNDVEPSVHSLALKLSELSSKMLVHVSASIISNNTSKYFDIAKDNNDLTQNINKLRLLLEEKGQLLDAEVERLVLAEKTIKKLAISSAEEAQKRVDETRTAFEIEVRKIMDNIEKHQKLSFSSEEDLFEDEGDLIHKNEDNNQSGEKFEVDKTDIAVENDELNEGSQPLTLVKSKENFFETKPADVFVGDDNLDDIDDFEDTSSNNKDDKPEDMMNNVTSYLPIETAGKSFTNIESKTTPLDVSASTPSLESLSPQKMSNVGEDDLDLTLSSSSSGDAF